MSELIINAMVHRSYLDHGKIQVAVYDDRLEITSPGKLPMSQTIERMKEGYSKVRNEALAHAFAYMNLIESWGSGIPKLMQAMKEYGLREPEFIDMDVAFRINLYRGQNEVNEVNTPDSDLVDLNDPESFTEVPDTAAKVPDNNIIAANGGNNGGDGGNNGGDVPSDLNETERIIYLQVSQDGTLTAAQMSEELGLAKRTIERTLSKLKEEGVIMRIGSSRSGKWEIRK